MSTFTKTEITALVASCLDREVTADRDNGKTIETFSGRVLAVACDPEILLAIEDENGETSRWILTLERG